VNANPWALPETDFWIKAGLSIVCGFVVGIERQIHRKPIDVRTSVLICLGTMVYIYLGDNVYNGTAKDGTRVLGQVITGIGFLGAGAIITRSGLVLGLTSASVVWVLAAVGAAIGFDFYGIGLAVSVLTVLLLAILHRVEHFAERVFRSGPPAA
jgi:putative Mg2+ transporter-C (MgtC) family protein